MRILVSFIGGLGHFYPLLPLARAAQAAGHDVAVACSGGLVERVQEAGFPTFPTSTPRPNTAPTGRDLSPLVVDDATAAEIEFAQNFADAGARRHAEVLPEVIAQWQPDVVIRDEAALGTALAAELAGVPVATVLVLAAGTLIRPDRVEPPLSALRAELGLPPDPHLAMLTCGLMLAPFPLTLRSPRSPVPLPASTVAFGSGAAPQRTPSTMGQPQVYATLGTVFNTTSGDLLERLVAALSGLDVVSLLTVGRDIDPAEFHAPAHVRIERFVPQADVLATCELMISHGGSGSLLAALEHGVASLVLPLGADQPHNAARAAELGVATVLDAATATPTTICDTITATLADGSLAANARQMAAQMAALPGPEHALAAVEQFAAT